MKSLLYVIGLLVVSLTVHAHPEDRNSLTYLPVETLIVFDFSQNPINVLPNTAYLNLCDDQNLRLYYHESRHDRILNGPLKLRLTNTPSYDDYNRQYTISGVSNLSAARYIVTKYLLVGALKNAIAKCGGRLVIPPPQVFQ